jgi:hypothetical protein
LAGDNEKLDWEGKNRSNPLVEGRSVCASHDNSLLCPDEMVGNFDCFRGVSRLAIVELYFV